MSTEYPGIEKHGIPLVLISMDYLVLGEHGVPGVSEHVTKRVSTEYLDRVSTEPLDHVSTEYLDRVSIKYRRSRTPAAES
jgi:hypothetical protein